MRIGVISRVVVRGDVTYVASRTEGDEDPEIVLVVPIGVHYEPQEGDPILILPMDATVGEFAAWPGRFLLPNPSADNVALAQDWTSLNSRVSALEDANNQHTVFYNAHVHNTPPGPMGVASGPPLPSTSQQVPSSTSATFTGSDRFLVTHE